jgi:hypothetical protein
MLKAVFELAICLLMVLNAVRFVSALVSSEERTVFDYVWFLMIDSDPTFKYMVFFFRWSSWR